MYIIDIICLCAYICIYIYTLMIHSVNAGYIYVVSDNSVKYMCLRTNKMKIYRPKGRTKKI